MASVDGVNRLFWVLTTGGPIGPYTSIPQNVAQGARLVSVECADWTNQLRANQPWGSTGEADSDA